MCIRDRGNRKGNNDKHNGRTYKRGEVGQDNGNVTTIEGGSKLDDEENGWVPRINDEENGWEPRIDDEENGRGH